MYHNTLQHQKSFFSDCSRLVVSTVVQWGNKHEAGSFSRSIALRLSKPSIALRLEPVSLGAGAKLGES